MLVVLMRSARSRTAVLSFVFLLDGVVLVVIAIVAGRSPWILTTAGHGLDVSVNLATLHLALEVRITSDVTVVDVATGIVDR